MKKRERRREGEKERGGMRSEKRGAEMTNEEKRDGMHDMTSYAFSYVVL